MEQFGKADYPQQPTTAEGIETKRTRKRHSESNLSGRAERFRLK